MKPWLWLVALPLLGASSLSTYEELATAAVDAGYFTVAADITFDATVSIADAHFVPRRRTRPV